jgi:hypothetical protein
MELLGWTAEDILHGISAQGGLQPPSPLDPPMVMRASSSSQTCMQRAVSAQMVERSLVKVHTRMHSAKRVSTQRT